MIGFERSKKVLEIEFLPASEEGDNNKLSNGSF
jgi:hypothetical protein